MTFFLFVFGCFSESSKLSQPPDKNTENQMEPRPFVSAAPMVRAPPQYSEMTLLWQKSKTQSVPPTAIANGVLTCAVVEEKHTLARIDVHGVVVWSTSLNSACSTPIVVAVDRLWVGVGDSVHSFDLRTGETLWSTPIDGLIQRLNIGENSPRKTFKIIGEDLLVGSEKGLFSLDPRTGTQQWLIENRDTARSYIFADSSGLVTIRAGSSSPFQGSTTSRWGNGYGYRLNPQESNHHDLFWSAEDIEEAVGAERLRYFVSAPVEIGDVRYFLMQRNQPVKPVEIRHVTSKDGVRRAVGGSRERPKPEGLTLLQHLPDGTWKGVDISSEVPHPTLAVGPLNNPKNNMIHSEAGLLFSTVSIDGEAVTLQAWTTDLSIHWQKNDHFLLAVSDQKIISGWDNSTTFDRLNAAYKTTGEMVLYVLDESGIEIGSLELPWPVFSMPFRPSCNGYYCYLSSPDKTLVAVQIP